MTTFGHKEKLWHTTEIQDNLVDGSIVFDNQTKQAFKTQSKFIRDFLTNNPKVNSYQLKSLTNELLTYWNESINPDTEIFWTELKDNGIDFERKEPLRFALTKKRFRNFEQGMNARKHWTKIKNRKEITDKYSQAEIEKIETIIADDENRRLEILKKCLRKNEIPQTQYLKFGECMAYINNCGLWEKYFNKGEVKQLYNIWTNFKSK